MEKEFPVWYCPICGMDNQLYSNTKCEWCDNSITMVKSKHSHTYYAENGLPWCLSLLDFPSVTRLIRNCRSCSAC